MKWLSTLFNRSCWLLACSLCFFFSSNVFAATCSPDEPTSTPSIGYYYVAGIQAYKYPSSSIACSSAAAVDQFWGPGYTGSGSGTGPSVCVVTKTSDSSTNQTSIDFAAGTCPTGFVVSGSICVNTCTPLDPCPTAGTTKKDTVALSGISGQQGIGTSMCADSGTSTCGIKCSSGIASYNEVSGQSSVYCESYEFTGSNCTDTSKIATAVTTVPSTNQATPLNNPPKSRQDCPGGSGFAEVNNVGMCLPGGTQVSGGSTTQSSSSGSVTTTSTTTINSTGGNTTTTITTYKDANGNITYEGTGVSNTGINQAAAGGGTGQGDKPSLGDAPTFDQTLPQEATFNIKAQVNPVFSTEIFQTSASCPAPVVFTAMNQEFTIDYAPVCEHAEIIRAMILFLAAVASMRIVTTS